MQYLGRPFGPSSNTCPKCISDDLDLTSVLLMPYLLSGSSYVAPSTGLVNESQPERETNLSSVLNKGCPLYLSTNIPSGVFLNI